MNGSYTRSYGDGFSSRLSRTVNHKVFGWYSPIVSTEHFIRDPLRLPMRAHNIDPPLDDKEGDLDKVWLIW